MVPSESSEKEAAHFSGPLAGTRARCPAVTSLGTSISRREPGSFGDHMEVGLPARNGCKPLLY